MPRSVLFLDLSFESRAVSNLVTRPLHHAGDAGEAIGDEDDVSHPLTIEPVFEAKRSAHSARSSANGSGGCFGILLGTLTD